MSLQLVSKLNLHFFENISTHPVVRNDDTRDSALVAFNQAINLYKPASVEERAIADFFRESFDNNQYATMTYLRRMNYLGLSQFISGRCIAMALGIENKIHIVTDKNGCYVSKISNRRDRARRQSGPRRDDAHGGQGGQRDSGRRDRRDSDRPGGRRDSDRQGGQGGRRDADRQGGQRETAPFRPRLQFNMDSLVGTVHWPVGTSWADIEDDEFDTPPTPPPKETAVEVAAAMTASMSLTPPVTPKATSNTTAPLPTPELE
jgi:hypothetical protein